LIHDVFPGDDGDERLHARLAEAREGGAELAVLPELPLDPWVPAGKTPRDRDAEPPQGPRHRRQAAAAREAGLALLGGAIVRDPGSGKRHNRALLFDAAGELVAGYDKLHVPNEEGFWEAEHYEPGTAPPERIDGLALPIGLQICSDLFRPQGCQLLGAAGAELILAPRCTPRSSYERWKAIIRSNAVTSTAYVLSTNRPRAEGDVPIGGPSLVASPDGELVAETTDAVAVVTLSPAVVAHARNEYPGYLAVRSGLYARAWGDVARRLD
jgi:predicted amidohydrolase